MSGAKRFKLFKNSCTVLRLIILSQNKLQPNRVKCRFQSRQTTTKNGPFQMYFTFLRFIKHFFSLNHYI